MKCHLEVNLGKATLVKVLLSDPSSLIVSLALYEKVELKPSDAADKTKPNNLIVVLSSDRGLCGGIHSNLVKAVKATLTEKEGENTKIVACGEKSRQLFLRTHGKQEWLISQERYCDKVFRNVKIPECFHKTHLAYSRKVY